MSKIVDSQPLYFASSVKKLTNKYSCIRQKCIYNQFSAFHSITIKGKRPDHFNRKSQKGN